jgi:hypothetical protein
MIYKNDRMKYVQAETFKNHMCISEDFNAVGEWWLWDIVLSRKDHCVTKFSVM